MTALVHFLSPYELSPTVVIVCMLTFAVYVAGLSRRGWSSDGARPIAFLIGLALVYVSLQTHYDLWAQHMFFVHRAQHLILHHVGPFLIALSAPMATLLAGMPDAVRRRVAEPVLANPGLGLAYRAIQQPFVSAFLFVALIYFWLIPSIHFFAMLNVPLYNTMNWSMALDGLLFWHLILDPRPPLRGRTPGYGLRIALLVAVIPPQILLGARIFFARHDLYPVYTFCGRLWPVAPMTDQQLGGLITWIPPAMMSVVAMLVVLSRWMRRENPAARPAAPVGRVSRQSA
jgi:putative membrane protein